MRLLISVIMPVFNSEKYVAEAIESILNQTFNDFEFIIIDDGSTDNSLKIIKEYSQKDNHIRVVVNQENKGIAGSLNIGIALARGEYIARMDADDISLPERFEKQVAFMENHPEIGVVGTSFSRIDEKENVIEEVKLITQPPRIWWRMFFINPIVHPSVMMRRNIFINGKFKYNRKSEPAEDYDLWFQIMSHYAIANLSEGLLLYRVHNENISFVKRQEQLRITEKVLKLRTEEILHMNLPEHYGRYIMGFSKIESLWVAWKVCWAISRLYRYFLRKFSQIDKDDRLFVQRDYIKKIYKIWVSQVKDMFLLPFISIEFSCRVQRKIRNIFHTAVKFLKCLLFKLEI